MAVYRIVSLVLALAIAISLMTPVMYAGTNNIVAYDELAKLRLEAKLLRNMIKRLLNVVNISEDLRLKIENLLKVNIDNLTYKELKLYVKKLRDVLKILRESIRSERLVNATAFVKKLRELVRKRLEKTVRRLNLSKEEIEPLLKKLRKVRSITELNKVLFVLRTRLLPAILIHNARSIERFLENKSYQLELAGTLRALDTAIRSSAIAIKLLTNVVRRLSILNISTPLINMLNSTIEKLAAANAILKEVKQELVNVSKEVGVNASIVKEVVDKVRKRLLIKLVGELLHLKRELVVLREAALALNRSDIAEKLTAMISKIDSVLNAIKSGKKVDLRILMELIIHIRKVERRIHEILHRYKVKEEVRYRLGEEVKKLVRLLGDLERRFRSMIRESVRLGLTTVQEELEKALNITKELRYRIRECLQHLALGNVSKAFEIFKDIRHRIRILIEIEKHVGKRLEETRKHVEHELHEIARKARKMSEEFNRKVEELRRLSEELNRLNTTLAGELQDIVTKLIREHDRIVEVIHTMLSNTNVTGARVALQHLIELYNNLSKISDRYLTLVNLEIEKLTKVLKTELENLTAVLNNITNKDVGGLVEKISEVQHEISVLIDKLDKIHEMDILHKIEIVIEVKSEISEIKHTIEHIVELDHSITSLKKEINNAEKRLHEYRQKFEEMRKKLSKGMSSNVKKRLEKLEEMVTTIEEMVKDAKKKLSRLELENVKELLKVINEKLTEISELLEELKG